MIRPYTTPGVRRMRDGSKQCDLRTREHWAIALKNHIRVSHGGRESPTCAGCRELKAKALESARK